jgi:hypothetical protein
MHKHVLVSEFGGSRASITMLRASLAWPMGEARGTSVKVRVSSSSHTNCRKYHAPRTRKRSRITSNIVRSSSAGPSPAQVLRVARGRFEAAVKLNPGHRGTSLANKTRALVWKSGSRSPHPVLKTHQRAFKRLKIMCLFPLSPNQCWTRGFAKGRAGRLYETERCAPFQAVINYSALGPCEG